MPENVTARREQQVIPTYIPKEPNAMPMFFEKKPYQGASGRLYPLPYSDLLLCVRFFLILRYLVRRAG